MSLLKTLVPLFLTLLICTLDGYAMMDYRLPAPKAYACFTGVMVFCLALNSYILVKWGITTLRNVLIFTVGLPYFLLILLITKDRISQTVFNFWLWINVYDIITNVSSFINDYTVVSESFFTALRLVLLCIYFVVYTKFLKKKHRAIMNRIQVNWWVFSFIPMFFTVLICLVNYVYKGNGGATHHYPLLLTIHALMLLVYILIFYTFKKAYELMEEEKLILGMKEQVNLQKKQYEFYLQKEETARIFRHDARHRDALLLQYLDNNDTERAKELLRKELHAVKANGSLPRYCENMLINAVLAQYGGKAKQKGLRYTAQIQMPEQLFCDEAEFCVMLSNLLENSLEAAGEYIEITIKCLHCQLSLHIKNDYSGCLIHTADGFYTTTKQHGSGLGLKSVDVILKKNHGFLKIDDADGIFDVYATLKNE